MLGRYVGGTALVLGVAMLLAPRTQPDDGAAVARAEVTVLNVVQPGPSVDAPPRPSAEPLSIDAPTLAAPTEPALPDAIAAAVREASADLAPPPPAAAPEPTVLRVTGDRVNVRAGPSTRYGIIASLRRDAEVELIDLPSASWAEIRLPEGEGTGYMARSFLSEIRADG